jgi:hypothetical protein
MPITSTPNLQAVTTAGSFTDKTVSITRELASTDSPLGTFLVDALVNNSGDPGAYNVQHNLTIGYTGGAYTSIPTNYRSQVTFTNPNSSGTLDLYSANFSVNHNSAATLRNLQGINSTIAMFGGGVATDAWSFRAGLGSNGGTLTSHCDYTNSSIWGGTLTNYYYSKPVAPTGAGAITNFYGLYIPSWTRGTNNYPIWIEDLGGVFFRNSATKINSSAAGQLDLTAATTVKINTAQLVLPNYSLPLADGTANYILKTDGAGTVTWQPDTGGSGSPGGADTEIQWNNAGAFDGTTGLHWLSGTSEFQFDDNIKATFGTGSDATIYYDGTDLIIDSEVVGTGELHLGSAMTGDLRLNKIGLGATAISNSFFINLQTSGNARGGMQFDYTATGTNPLVNMFLKSTSQHTNVSPTTGGCQATITKNEDSSLGYATTNPKYYGFYAQLGTSNASTVTAGTQNFYGFWADLTATGRGTANTGGNIYTYGLKVEPTLAYTGVASQVDYGVFTEEDIGLSAGVRVGFNDTATAKGTTYLTYNSTLAEMELYVGNSKRLGIADNTVIPTLGLLMAMAGRSPTL